MVRNISLSETSWGPATGRAPRDTELVAKVPGQKNVVLESTWNGRAGKEVEAKLREQRKAVPKSKLVSGFAYYKPAELASFMSQGRTVEIATIMHFITTGEIATTWEAGVEWTRRDHWTRFITGGGDKKIIDHQASRDLVREKTAWQEKSEEEACAIAKKASLLRQADLFATTHPKIAERFRERAAEIVVRGEGTEE